MPCKGELEQEVRFFQLMLLTSGLFTGIQSLWGHRYPLLDGPSTALLLTLIVLAPYGMASIQGGLIAGSLLLILLVLIGKLGKVVAYATPNVVGVILMLIAFSLLPHLTRIMAGVDGRHPHGDAVTFSICLAAGGYHGSFFPLVQRFLEDHRFAPGDGGGHGLLFSAWFARLS